MDGGEPRPRRRGHRRSVGHDGRPRGAIRTALDDEQLADTAILAYSAKFASAFYGPFREAAGSAPSFGDRRGYQLEVGNGRQALREALLDADEGADMLMVKPALAYGDLIGAARRSCDLPIAAYNVSGEYAMVRHAALAGALDERATVLEILTSLRRAGADTIITYHAKDAARWLQDDEREPSADPPRAHRSPTCAPASCTGWRLSCSPAVSTRRSARCARSAAIRCSSPAATAPS